MSNNEPVIWGVFVGEKGEQLEIFNSSNGPFPPEAGDQGLIAIGWPAIGDMSIYDDYTDFLKKFGAIYPDGAVGRKANMVWNFAKRMNRGDLVICPSSHLGYLLVGEILNDYSSDFHDETGLYGRRRDDFVHLRQVVWKHVISADNPKYGKLHRIGLSTVCKTTWSYADLMNVVSG